MSLQMIAPIAGIAGNLFGAMAQRRQAQSIKEQADIDAYVARTRAMQEDTVARQGLESEIGSARAVFGANAQSPNASTFDLLSELRDTRNRERRIGFGNRMMEGYAAQTRGRNAVNGARMAVPMAMFRSGPNILDLYQGLK